MPIVIHLTFDPILGQLGPLQLSWHGLFTALAVLVAVWLGIRWAEQWGFPGEALTDVATWGIVGGIVGARLFFVLDHWAEFLANPLSAFAIWEGGIAVYGAFLGGIFGGAMAARRCQVPAWPLLDITAPALLVGQAIGRLGCLSNGDAWGAPCSGPLCVVYDHPDALLPASLHGVPTHPYPLYEIGAELLLLATLWLTRRWTGPAGARFLLAAFGYAVIRFGLSFFRQEAVVLAGLQQAQLIAIATAALAIGLLVWRLWSAPGGQSGNPLASNAT